MTGDYGVMHEVVLALGGAMIAFLLGKIFRQWLRGSKKADFQDQDASIPGMGALWGNEHSGGHDGGGGDHGG